MKNSVQMPKKQLRYLVLLAVPVVLFFAMRARLSWRPRVLGQVQGDVTVIAWSPDGRWLAFAPSVENASLPVEIWDVSRGKLWSRWKLKGGYDGFIQFSGDSKILYCLGGPAILQRWQVPLNKELPPSPIKIKRLGFSLSPDDKVLMQDTTGIAAHDIETGRLLWKLSTDDPLAIVALSRFSADGKKLAILMWQSSVNKGASITIWNVDSPQGRIEPEKTILIERNDVKSSDMIFDDQRKIIHLLGWMGEIVSYDLKSGTQTAKLEIRDGYSSNGNEISTFSPDNLYTVVISTNQSTYSGVANSIQIREWPKGQTRRTLNNVDHPRIFRLPTFSPDGGTLAAVDAAGFITLWRIK